MGRFALRRLMHGLIVVGGVTIIVFIVTRLVGDPVQTMLPFEASQAQVDAFRTQFGFDQPIPVQFATYIGDLVRGDLGESLWQRRPTATIIAEQLPRTLQLVFASMFLAVLIALPLGIIAALRPGQLLDRFTVTLSLIGLSVPQFWLGLLFVMVFAVRLGWLPSSGMGTWRHMILPTITLALPAAGRIAMLIRSSMIDELNQQYIQTAKAKDLSFLRIVGLHAFRNASIPALTLTAWELIRALAGYSVIVETVFAWPGLGLAAIQAVERQDLILLQGIVLVVAVLVVAVNITVDIVYKAIDPRIKLA